jgi:hypothetical protein
MAKFYRRKFEREIANALSSKALQREALRVVRQKVDIAHKEMVEDFDSHPVTLELEAGATAQNFSGTLGGYGNLFTFIGFSADSQPTRPIRRYLNRVGRVSHQPKIIKKQARVDMIFRVKTPLVEDIEDVSPSPWAGRSWTRGIERGISGLGYYMYSRSNLTNSRSGRGLQSSKEVRAMAYRPIKYMTSILSKFYDRIK